MQAITTIGLDIAKSVFQVHGVAADGQVVIAAEYSKRATEMVCTHASLHANQARQHVGKPNRLCLNPWVAILQEFGS